MPELFEMEIKKSEDRLTDLYIQAYEKRYGIKPVLANNGSDHTILKDLVRQLGFSTISKLVPHYLEMDNEWFVKKAHSLPVLKNEINVVNADYGMHASRAVSPSQKMLVSFPCDGCRKNTAFAVPLNYNWEHKTLCRACGGSHEHFS